MRQVSAVAAGLVIASAALAAGYVNDGDPSSDGGSTAVTPCQSIAGSLGILTEWTHAKPTTKSQTSTDGVVGANYAGTAAQICLPLAAPVPTESSSVIHRYKRTTGVPTSVAVTLSAAASASGTAVQSDISDPSWWWVPTIAVDDDAPYISVNYSNGSSGTVSFATTSDAYDEVSVQGTGGSATPANGATLTSTFTPNTGKFASGSFSGSTGPIAGTASNANPKADKIAVIYTTNSSTNREADNAVVSGWRVVITSTLTSSVSP